jgi:periodic tryptophan protein 2
MEEESKEDRAVNFFRGKASATEFDSKKDTSSESQAHKLVNATWTVQSRHYFHQEGASVTAASYCQQAQLLVVGFSSGIFGLYEMPTVSNIHTLSVGSNQIIKTCVLNTTGDWLALGCPTSQQLLVWEWRSETYVLKQRGHAYGMRTMAYSPDGVVICTGGEDGKLKLWNATSGFCYVTLEQSHTAPITAVAFCNASVVLSSSLDGTVRAHDLHRYRTFKTLTTPTPVQFLSLAVDPSGEIVAAGTTDPFHIYVWNLQTAKLLDVLTGHEGPVCDLAFQKTGGMLASASWDGTMKLWDLYKGNVPSESAQHASDVVCVAFRPDGKEICTGTIGGLLSFWNTEDAKLKYEIDGRRDIAGGRKLNDRMTSDNNASSRYFTSVCYSADGSCILAGGNSKYVCIYEVSQQMLLKKFQVTFNRSLDGVLDELHSKNLGEGGVIDEEEGSEDETTYNALTLPGAKRGDDGSRKSRVEVLTSQVAFSSTGREWAAVSGEGLHVYSLDDDMIFDPISLTEAITPAAVEARLASGDYGVALRMAIHLNEYALVKEVLENTPYGSITHVVRSVGPEQLEKLMQFVSKSMENSPHIEFYLEWCLQLLQTHGLHLEKHRGSFMRAFRAMHKTVQTRHDELKTICDENKYTLDFLENQTELNMSTH